MKKAALLLLLITGFSPMMAQGGASRHPTIVKEYEQVFTTYPYSDPDPVPVMSKFYPYYRYDGFTDTPVEKKWKVVELSNDYLQLLILPEIGGKVWAAIDKTTGRSFVYFNHVVKFRDVSMRGPWTSGGVEPNYGIMGHTPNCFSPVNYLARRNADGSASCIIGVLDLLTRSTWRLEITLPAGQACFSTRSFWHNASENEQPYYTWMNVGIKAAGNLEFVNPGTQYLGHDGLPAAWPLNPENGHTLSWYEQNNFGPYKSYHVVGCLAECFGGYWHDEDFGMAHYAPYADKPGRKIWIWGLSREGMIWEKLLTDTDGQYVEVQSGRLFNQAAEASSLTPFKHLEFPPFATDTWQEYWMPVKGTKGFVSASPWGALNVVQESGRLIIRISPVRTLRDKLEVFDGNRRLFVKEVQLRPMQPLEEVVSLSAPVQNLKVCLGGDKLCYDPAQAEALSRPVKAPANFDWTSPYGHYLKGKENARQRAYVQAAEEFQSCLKLEPTYAPALVEMASLANRAGDRPAASEFALQALRVDTYDPGANFQLGLASAALGRNADAKDAFSIASLSPGWRSASCLELAKAFLREQRYERALASVQDSLDNNTRNLDALQLRACLYRLQGDPSGAQITLKALLALDPLNHFARFEKYLQGKGRRQDVTGLIRNELPQETYLELAAWYHGLRLDADGAKVLELAPPTAEVLYWLAYLSQDSNRLARAEAASPAFVFPFRPESIAVFEWAAKQSRAWQPKYYLALLRWHLGDLSQARDLLAACGEEPRFGPFYAARAQVCEDNVAGDLQKAARLDPGQWRYGAMLARHCLKQGDSASALAAAADYARRFPANDILALLHAKALLSNTRYQAAADLLSSLNLLPCEGSTEARSLFREAHLMLAVARLKSGAFAEARPLIQKAREWPEHLGAGKPYPEDVDERLEDWLAYQCALGSNAPGQARQMLDRLLTWRSPSHSRGVGEVIRALALRESGQSSEAQQLLEDWQKDELAGEVANWGLEVLAGRSASLSSKRQNADSRVLSAWLESVRVP
jgi:tetratricopeptide (TPR) repeat protein